MAKAPAADPWTDTDVIDERAPRTNQAVVALTALLAAIFGWPWLWALMAAQLGIGLTLGRRYCLPCLAYFRLIQPRLGEGRLEDSRPPRLANMIGFAFLSAAAVLWWLGAETAATALGLLVAALALLAAVTGFCTGCEIYRLGARLRGISPRHNDRFDSADLGAPGGGDSFVLFTHPLCSECHEWESRLGRRRKPLIRLDVRDRPDLARKYGISVVPAVFSVGADGEVVERLAP